LATEIGYADKYIPELRGMSAIWKEFEPAFYNHIISTFQKYMTNRIAEIAQKFPLGSPTGNDAVTKLLYESEELEKSISQITFPLKK
jgi:chitinase